VHARLGLLTLVAVILLLSPAAAVAVPDLQLVIPEPEGYYDPITQTWVTSSDEFTLQAIVDDDDVFRGQDSVELYLCVALSDDLFTLDGNGDVVFADGMSLSINGAALTAADFEYGLPPISDENLDGQGGDLAPHEIYPTAFAEIAFTITDPGIYEFQIANAVAGIHFDLYSLKSRDRIDIFAPFSHDAGTVPSTPVPEPSTLALLVFAGVFVPLGKHLGRKHS